MSVKTYPFVANDESIVNDYGFRVLTAGIDTKQHKRNPLVLWFHKRPKSWESSQGDDILPIGKAVKLWKEDGKMMIDVEFDQNDEFAKKIESKVDGGFINMCSLGINPITVSDDPKYLLPGQTRPTIVKSELIEVSITDIGSNKNALALYNDDGDKINLASGEGASIIPLIDNSKKSNKMKEVAIKLGLDADASKESIMRVLDEKLSLVSQFDIVKKERDDLKTAAGEAEEGRILTLVSENVDKKFTADKKDHFVEMGKKVGYDQLKLTFDSMASIINGQPTNITGNSDNSDAGAEGGAKMKFADLVAKGKKEVERFKTENRDEYIKLYKAEYGEEPNFDYEK